jgi:long-chain fatty acid transport protein
LTALRLAAAAALLAPGLALATAGYFQHGYGLKAKGIGGAAAAFPQDALVAATNPAGMVWLGNRLDVGLDWFEADRGSTIHGNDLGLSGTRDANGRKRFPVPELGVNRMLGERLSLGLAVYGNGGMTRYFDNPLGALGGATAPAGLEFAQLIVAPTLAMKLGERHSLGASLKLVHQRLAARGLEHFDDPLFSAAPGQVTNRGRDRSNGVGLRVGWMGRVTEAVTLGAAWQPKIRMSRFSRYSGLLAGGGNFDVPANFVAGAALRAAPRLTLVADAQRIAFSGVRSFGNRADCFLSVACLLGADNGPGSGWRDVTVWKLGASWDAAPGLALRGGVALLRQPIPASQTLLNVFAPAVTERHLTLGATWQVAPRLELTLAYMHAFEKQVRGSGSVPAGPPPAGVGGGEADLRMKQRALGVALGWRM